MKITWIDEQGARHHCKESYTGAPHAVAKGACPVCHNKAVLIAHDTKQTAIFAEKDRARALAHLVEQGAVEPEELGPPPPGEVYLRGKHSDDGEYECRGDALCTRCRSRIGTLAVKYDTLFGISEDRRILSGRYGVVL